MRPNSLAASTIPHTAAETAVARDLAMPEDGDTIVEEDIAGRAGPIRLRRFLPGATAAQGAAILFLHGGGAQHDPAALCRRLVALTGAQVIAVYCRPGSAQGAVEDAGDAYVMMLARAADWAVDPARTAVAGCGAGATLAALVAIHARDMCLRVPAAQLLIDPLAEVPQPGSPRRRKAGDPAGTEGWRLAPLQAGSLAGLPPAFIVAAHAATDALALAGGLTGAGGVVTMWPWQEHPTGADRTAAMLVAAAAFLRPLLATAPGAITV